MKKVGVLVTIVGAAMLTAVPVSLNWSQQKLALSIDSAEARIGRPLTATSVAGVHRRAYRRAAYAGVAGAALGYGVGSYYGGYGYPASSYYSSYPSYSSSYYGSGYGGYAATSPSWGTGYSYGGYGYPSSYGYNTYPVASWGFGWRQRPWVGWRSW